MQTVETIFTTSNITFGIGIIGIIFTIYNYFRNPQIRSDKIDALLEQKLGFVSKSFEDRFCRFDRDLVNLRDNHIHTLDTKLDSLASIVNQMGKDVVKLSTIIEERIPKS